MRIYIIFGFILFSIASTQAVTRSVWEKLLLPGLSYRMEFEPKTPLIIHALRYSPGTSYLKLIPESANSRFISEAPSGQCKKLSSIIQRTKAIAGINADYFPMQGGVPIGAMVKDGELLTSPYLNRSVFAWGPRASGASKLTWHATLTPQGRGSIKLSSLNKHCGLHSIALYTPSGNMAFSKLPNIYVLIKMDAPTKWTPRGAWKGTVISLHRDLPGFKVPENHAVIAARGNAVASLASLSPGQQVIIKMETRGLNWTHAHNVIGGGPFLCRYGEAFIDWKEQKFTPFIALQRHPRTAIGRTRHGDIWLVTVDGRNPLSRGVTLQEMASIMLRLGCIEAINLDGGGSTTLNLFGTTHNRPDSEKERKIANAILIHAPSLTTPYIGLKIEGPTTLQHKSYAQYKLLDATGKEIPNREVLWKSDGSAWIDQGGTLHTLKTGNAKIYACTRGMKLCLNVEIMSSSMIVVP